MPYTKLQPIWYHWTANIGLGCLQISKYILLWIFLISRIYDKNLNSLVTLFVCWGKSNEP